MASSDILNFLIVIYLTIYTSDVEEIIKYLKTEYKQVQRETIYIGDLKLKSINFS